MTAMKPRIFTNLAISLDGKIADRATPKKPLGTPLDRKKMDVIRNQADVVVMGASTLAAYPHPIRIKKFLKGRKKQLVNAVVTASGNLDPSLEFWNAPDVVRFVFTSLKGFEPSMRAARDRAFVVIASDGKTEDEVNLSHVIARLKKSGLTQILVEGGGELVASFLKEKLVHDMYVTLTPWVLGGRSNPSLVGGSETLPEWSKLKILSSKKVKDEIYLHLQVKGSRRV